ncbi:MAG: hypothetical protein NTW49_11815 [Bacteroidia bacterium]|nr:hypothetical protein [Bacteroidia bacterium]
MDIFKKNKILISIVVILTVLNIASLITLWLMNYRDFHHRLGLPQIPPQELMQKFLNNELNLSDKQSDFFRKSGNLHFTRVRNILDSIHEDKKQMFDELFKEHPDTLKIRGLISNIGRKQAEIERVTFNNFLIMKNKCNAVQQLKFKLIFREMLDLIDPSKRLPGPHPPSQLPDRPYHP